MESVKLSLNHELNDLELTENNILNKLNFYCLVHICSFLELKDLAHLDIVSKNFKPIVEHTYKRYKSLDFHSIRPVTFSKCEKVFNKIGSYITSIKIDGRDLQGKETNGIQLPLLITSVCYNLENISYKSIAIYPEILRKMTNMFPKLKSIELINCGINDFIGHYLKIAQVLENLNLKGNIGIFGSCISKIKNLVSLNLNNCLNVQPQYFTDFCLNNKNLIKLDITNCNSLTSTSVTDITNNLIHLEELTISSSYDELTSSDFLEFENLPKLKKLHIVFNNSINKNIADLINSLAEKDLLQFLDISRIPITKQLFESLVNFTKLEILKINYSFFYLNNEMLSELMLKKENIKEVHISNCGMVTTAGLIILVENSPNLRVLNISECYYICHNFYYKVLEVLKEQNRPNRLTVFVYRTKIIEKYFNSELLAKNLPWIQLIFDSIDCPYYRT